MAKTIAVSGKGGAGKTTISAMIIRTLIERSGGNVLAVDADPNACLAMTLGAEVITTIAEIRELARTKDPNDVGSDRIRTFEYGIQQAITEAKGFDLITMGQPEGPSCYCAANNLLRKFLDKLSDAYRFVILDNEAGMEHLSRRTTNNIDLLAIIAEPTPVGQVTARRIHALTERLPITVRKTGIIWNRSDEVVQLDGITNFGCVPLDPVVQQASMQGKTTFEIDTESTALSAVSAIISEQLEL